MPIVVDSIRIDAEPDRPFALAQHWILRFPGTCLVKPMRGREGGPSPLRFRHALAPTGLAARPGPRILSCRYSTTSTRRH
jgi:hypothetical protein